jgi:sortase A
MPTSVPAAVRWLEGDDERALRIAAGHLRSTPLPWQEGNSVVAAHRDTFFRPLQHVRTGDYLLLVTAHGTLEYQVSRLRVVAADDWWVVHAADDTDLMLITCYPFNFVGPAPRRFIVQAQRLAHQDSPRWKRWSSIGSMAAATSDAAQIEHHAD